MMEGEKKTERLSPHPFQPSRREKGKQEHPRAMASLLDPTECLTDNSRGTCGKLLAGCGKSPPALLEG